MSTYVLVAGAWLGGWCWQPVARHLRNHGHDVYPVTLTGLGERVHLSGPQVNLDTHIDDVVNLIEFEDLHDVVLLGHSYAGAVVTGVADRIPGRLSQLVYLDSGQFPDGVAYLNMLPPKVQHFIEGLVTERGDGWRIPLPSWDELENVMGVSLAGLGDDQRKLMRARAVPQPLVTYTQPLRLEKPTRNAFPKLLISCSFPLTQVQEMIASGHPWFRELAGPEWQFLELPTGHWPMFSVPEELATLLLGLPLDAPNR